MLAEYPSLPLPAKPDTAAKVRKRGGCANIRATALAKALRDGNPPAGLTSRGKTVKRSQGHQCRGRRAEVVGKGQRRPSPVPQDRRSPCRLRVIKSKAESRPKGKTGGRRKARRPGLINPGDQRRLITAGGDFNPRLVRQYKPNPRKGVRPAASGPRNGDAGRHRLLRGGSPPHKRQSATPAPV